jgi:predicted phosphodiesterase
MWSERSISASILPRREFLAVGAGLVFSLAQPIRGAHGIAGRTAFFLVGDTHYLANEHQTDELDHRSRQVTSALINTLSRLPGTVIPDAAGGGMVATPNGVIHAGDIIDSGDKNGAVHKQMQETEWKAYCEDFSIHGIAGLQDCPVYEVHGNHDGPQAVGYAMDGIAERNRVRASKGLGKTSANGLMMSWDWGDVHFVNLGIVVGQQQVGKQKRRYAPADSLDFLVEDLKVNVGSSGRPVVLTHHIDLARYSVVCSEDDPDNRNREWHPCDLQAFYKSLAPYRVAGLLHGHTHVRDVYKWQGTTQKGSEGLSVFNVDNSSHFKSDAQAFLYFEIQNDQVLVRECATRDAWKTFFWTPQVWKAAF